MKTVLLKSQVNVWFDYLKIADRLGLDIDWNFYEEWGSPGELRALKFGTWWRQKGSWLFEAPPDAKISVTSVRSGFVNVRIPAHWTVRELRREIGPVFAAVRLKTAPKGKAQFVINGRFSYGDFVTYKRLLELDLAARKHGRREVMGNLITKFRADEKKRKDRAESATQTSTRNAAARGKRRHRKFRAVEVKVTPNEQRNGYIWLKKARKIAENVARGGFPRPRNR
jgi:hypothetical protein